MAINSDTDIHIALVQLGKNANFYRLDQNVVPHKIIDWSSDNKDSQPTDDELNTAYATWKAQAAAVKYKTDRTTDGSTTYAPIGDQLDLLWHAIDADADLKVKFSAFYNSIKAVKDANPKP